MKRPANDAWFEKQRSRGAVRSSSTSRSMIATMATRCSSSQLDALIDQAMCEARDAAAGIADRILMWARSVD
jgi:hypothetical protein